MPVVTRKYETYRFENMENMELDCCSGFCPNIGVLGADPRLHAFSYDVSRMENGGKTINIG